jgi:hypothetical protein
MPDGTVVEMPDQLDSELGTRLRAFSDHEAVKANPTEGAAWRTDEDAPKGFYAVTGDDGSKTLRRERGIGDTLMDLPGVGAALHATAGAVNTGLKALGGLKGLVTGDVSMPKVELPQGNDPVTRALGAVQAGAEKVAAPIDRAVENLPDGARTIVQSAEEAIPDVAGVLGARVPLKAGAAALKEAAVSGAAKASQGDVIGTLRAAGYKLRPSDVQAMKPGERVPGTRRESLQDPAALRKDFTLENQATTTKLAAEDLGATGKTSLMQTDYDKLRQPHFKVYEDVEKAVSASPSESMQAAYEAAKTRTGFKPTDKPSTTQVIGALRRQEVKRARSEDVATNREGQLDRDAADTLEDQLEAQLKASGNQQLYTDYVASRRALAKIHDYETATRGGQVDAQKLFRMDQKNPGRFTGNAKIIADAGGYAKNVVRHSQGATGTRSSVKSEGVFSAIKDAGRGLLGKIPGLDVTADGFQNNFGREAVTPAERSSFRDYGKRPEKPQAPEEVNPQQSMDLAQGFGLDAPPGVAPARIERPFDAMPTEQLEALGPLMDLVPSEGVTPSRIMPPTPMPGADLGLADILNLVAPEGAAPARIMPPVPKPGEQWFDPSLDLAPPPGRVGKASRKPAPAKKRETVDLAKLLAPDEP